jgi:hypothetical protein
VLGGLVGLIVLSANPFGPLAPAADRLWPGLAALGIDVAMTPLTFDMMMMYDPRTRTSLYERKVEVIYWTEHERRRVPFEALSFYRWRIPAILFAEEYLWGTDTRAHRYALCHELERRYGPGLAFMIQVDVPDSAAKPFGLNTLHACR